MNYRTPLAIFASLVVAGLAQGEPKKVDHVVELLEQAKTSPTPLPLLEKAKAEFKDFKGSAVHEERVGKKMARAEKSENEALNVHRKQAEERIEEAIKDAKGGANALSPINAAIAEVHLAGAYKR